MKKIYSLIVILTIVSCYAIYSQENAYSTKKINGKEYFLYTVQQGEGIYGISKKFDVTQEELSKVNPEINSGLKNGQQLLVPVTQKNKQLKAEVTKKATPTSFIEHKVEKKQTLFAISRKYNVSQEEIKNLNPEINSGLKEGMILKIPQHNSQNTTSKSETNSDAKKNVKSNTATNNIVKPEKAEKAEIAKRTKDTYQIHVVKPKETLYSISKLYNVDIADIIKLNPDCDKTIKTGSELKIPYSAKQTSNATTVTNTQPADETGIKLNDKVKPNAEPIRIAFLLPFMLDSKTDNSAEKFVEFYSGALLAINEAKERGVSFEIYCYDTEKSEQKLSEILQKDALKDVDLIIGPAYSNQIPIISEFSRENRINTLVPFSSKVFDIDSNPYLFQFNPGSSTKASFMANIIEKKFRYDNIVFVNLSDVSVFDEGKNLTDELKSNLSKNKIEYTEITASDPEYFDINSKLKSNHENFVLFNTEKFSTVQPYINKLADVSDYQIYLYSEMAWQNQNLKNLNSVGVSPFKNKLNDQKIKKYQSLFKKYFNWEISDGSPRYDLLGYDLTTFFIAQIFYYGTNFTLDKSKLQEMSGVQSQLKFERSYKNSGFENQQLNFIEYNGDSK